MTARHVAYVLKRFPRISETFIAAELVELMRQGERVTVFAVSRPDEPFAHGFVADMTAPLIYLPYRPIRQPRRVLRALRDVLRRDRYGFGRAARAALWPPRIVGLRHLLQATVLRSEMADAGIDHAHAHFATTAARLANLSWRMGGPTYSVTTHAKDIWHRDVAPDRLRDKLAGATFVATVTDDNRRHLEAVLGDTAPPIHVVHNAVDLRRLGPAGERRPDPASVLCVARLIEKKGVGDLVEACGRLTARGRAVHLQIVGAGPQRAALEELAAHAGVDAVFFGALPHEAVVDLYRRATVFSLPCVVASTGDRDGMPTAVLEAMALGVPVVTTSVNGLAEAVIDGETGLAVAEHDPASLADAIERVLADPALATRLAVAARHHVERHFALDASVARLRELFPA